ncbi:hypothetical protein niasHT_007191 [Heterodera trifolii]|uniref:triacylglycerol lipase n=1 Tax=Heterodera trifolii TaxID=157864 RepID=A0ABD2LKY2_9BILA
MNFRNNWFSNANLSLCGCGFLCIYHAGVCAALREYAPQLTRNRIYGASAGSIAAAGLICNVSVAEATTSILQVVAEARAGVLQAFSPTFDLMNIVRDELDRILPDNAHQLCSGRLFISLTEYSTGQNAIISEFANKKELIQAILCSCFIPIFCGYTVPEFRGVRYIDGGFSDNQPVYDQNTITISPFSGESDICPLDHASASILGFVYYNTSIRFNNENFYRFCSCFVPPSQEICSKICLQGFTDALRFLTTSSITPCTKCLILSTQKFNSLMNDELKRSRSYFNIQQASASATTPKRRKRLDSECGVCMARLEQRLSTDMTTALFPEILHRTLKEPITCASLPAQLFRYARTFRAVEFGLRIADPFLRSLDYVVYVMRMLNEWLLKLKKGDLILDRLQKFLDFLLSQIEDQNLLCTPNISCQYQFTASRVKDTHSEHWLMDEMFNDLHENMHNEIVQQELILANYYNDPQNTTNSVEIEESLGNVLTEQKIDVTDKSVRHIEKDSGISSTNTSVAVSGISSDDGRYNVRRKTNTANSPTKTINNGTSRPNKQNNATSRRHTTGISSIGTDNANSESVSSSSSFRRRSAHSLNKPTFAETPSHSFAHPSSVGVSQINANKQRKLKAAYFPSDSSCSGDESGGPSEQPTRMVSRQRRDSDGGYEGDPSSDT